MSIATRTLGASPISVSPICLGTNVFGWTVDEPTAFRVLDAFVDAGLNFIDTADSYSKWAPGNQGGESETTIGNWVKRTGKRDQVVIATKVGWEITSQRKGLSKAYILESVEGSLRRLQTDHIDLYQSHIDDLAVPFEETLEAYAQLLEQGKVRAIGASNHKADRLAQALEVSRKHGLPAYRSLQPLYNLYDRAVYEAELEPLCLREGLGVIPYFGLASGFLTGKYRSEKDLGKSLRGGGVKKYMTDRGFAILDALDQVAARHSATPAQVAVAWLMARPSITAPIVSATSVEHVQQLAGAASLALDADSIELLNQASQPGIQ